MAIKIRNDTTIIDHGKDLAKVFIGRTISFIDQLLDVKLLVPGFNNFLGPDLAITSWAELELMDLDWGEVFGRKAESLRLPKASFDG